MNDLVDFLCDLGRALGILSMVSLAAMFAIGLGVAAAVFGG